MQEHFKVREKAQKLLNKLEQGKYLQESSLRQLKLRIKSLEYRIGKVHPLSEDEAKTSDLYKTLKKTALEWKENYRPCRKKVLTERDKKRLVELACYPEMINELIQEDEKESQILAKKVDRIIKKEEKYKEKIETEIGLVNKKLADKSIKDRKVRRIKKKLDGLEQKAKKCEEKIKLAEGLLKKEKKTELSQCFKWIIKSHLSGSARMEFPTVTKKIDECYLKGRIGKNIPAGLAIDTSSSYKDLTLLFETVWEESEAISILDGSKVVTLPHNLILTIDEIFTIFANKNLEESFLSVKRYGITNCSQNHLGAPVDGITKKPILYDLDDPDLFVKLQREFYTTDKAQEYFKKRNPNLMMGFDDSSIDGNDLVFTVEVASQNGYKLATSGTHASVSVWIPVEGGYIRTDNIGKFTNYPKKWWHSVKTLSGIGPAYFQCKDNNQEYPHREKVKMHYRIPQERVQEFLDDLRSDFKSAQEGEESFQLLTENCTDWAQGKVRKYVSEEESKKFEVDFLELQPPSLLSVLFKVSKKVPMRVRHRFFTIFAACIGGANKTKIGNKKACLLNNPPWKRKFRHPAQIGQVYKKRMNSEPSS